MTKKRKSNSLGLVGLALVAVGAAWGLGVFSPSDDGSENMIAGAKVERGDLRISVVERGNLEAADSETLKCEIEGQTTVLWLVEEGIYVEEGDLLVELDTSDLVERRVQQEIQVQNSEATLTKAQQNHAIQLSQNESDIANAKRKAEFALIDLEKYIEGDMPQELQSKDEAILLASEELTRAQQDLKWSEELHSRGFLEQAELDADRFAETRSTVMLKQAERAKELFDNYEIPRSTKELEAGVEEMDRELERVTLQAKARIADFEVDVRTAEAKFELESNELDKMISQIGKARIEAPVAGMVVYAVDSRSRWDEGEPMQEGSQVRERQAIITIPNSDGFIAEASLHESILEKVTTGMSCLVTVDALGKTLPGEVIFKAPLPDQQSRWMNPDLRVYRTTIQILASEPRIRPGMSCSIEILVDELKDVIYVPVQAVFLDAGKTICLVNRGNGDPEKRSVEVGQNNGKWVEIRSGLEAGETVLLAVPANLSLEPAKEGRSRDEAAQGAPVERGQGDEPTGERPKGDKTKGDKPKDGQAGGGTPSGTEHEASVPGGGLHSAAGKPSTSAQTGND